MARSNLRIVFAGTPEFAATHLNALISASKSVVSVYSQPDRPKGRGKKLLPPPVKALALEHGIDVFQPSTLKDPVIQQQLREQQPDVMVVVAYGLLLPAEVLAIPTFGCINVHASLLPRWRGAAPIERAILAGDKVSGVSLMQMNAGLDTGPVILSKPTPLTQDDNSQSLTERLEALGCTALLEVLDELANTGVLQSHPQDDAQATYAAKLHKQETGIDWQQPAQSIVNQVRAFYPRSPAWCLFDQKRLRIIHCSLDLTAAADTLATPGTIMAKTDTAIVVACGRGAIRIDAVQFEGKNEQLLADIFNGRPNIFAPKSILMSAQTDA